MTVTFDTMRHNEEIRALLEAGDEALGVIGFTDHGYGHAGLVSKVAGDILETLGYDERTCELGLHCRVIHDIGNAVNRSNHALTGALLAYEILLRAGMSPREAHGHHHRHWQPRRRHRRCRDAAVRCADPCG